MTGRFLSLEGGEGTGKSTQVGRLAAALEARGLHVVTTREPGGSEGAEAIRALLMQGELSRWSPHAEALLFAAARADHVEKVIRPALAAGSWVVSDRFIDSTRAYQGSAGGLDDAALLALHAFGSRGLLPDRTFVLCLDCGEGNRRAGVRDGSTTDRFAVRDMAFHTQVERAFIDFAQREPERFRMIDARQDQAGVTAAILRELDDLLP